jgi:predicted GIY-YIG superfamily endonuclease
MPEWSPKSYRVLIVARGPRGVLDVGITSDLPGRAWKHREQVLEGFSEW